MKPIQLYYRTTDKQSTISGRPSWFSKESCLKNLIDTCNHDLVDITIVVDTNKNTYTTDYRTITISSEDRLEILKESYKNNNTTYTDRDLFGNEIQKREEPPDLEKASGQLLYEQILNDNLDDHRIIYVVEDDYLHLPQWAELLVDFYQRFPGYHYISLYDHPDKYSERYTGLQSEVVISNYSHWRTVPSTCGTFAVPSVAFKEDYEIHHDRLGDHNKWQLLTEKGRSILSCIPGRATHCMQQHLSPMLDWSMLLR